MEYDLIINTDGVCSGNPGEMGIGVVVTNVETREVIYTVSRSMGIGTNNQSEFLAINDALHILEGLNCNKENILIQCSSHLALLQLGNDNYLEADAIGRLKTNIIEYSKLENYKIKFLWIPHEKNRIAHALAAKGAKMPIAYFQNGTIVEWESSFCSFMNSTEIDKLPAVNINTMSQISQLNSSQKLCISNVFSLMSFGADKYSRAKTSDLLNFIKLRFGDYTKEYMIKTLEDIDCTYSKNVLRWVARGLNPNLAFIKAALELEIKENTIE